MADAIGACAACGKDEAGHTFKACSACQLVKYCSKTCQKEHWKSSHRGECAKLRDRDSNTTSNQGTKPLCTTALGLASPTVQNLNVSAGETIQKRTTGSANNGLAAVTSDDQLFAQARSLLDRLEARCKMGKCSQNERVRQLRIIEKAALIPATSEHHKAQLLLIEVILQSSSPNETEAIRWLKRAAEGGGNSSSRELQELFVFGKNCLRKHPKAFSKWVTMSAQLGVSNAERDLGLYHCKGEAGFEQSNELLFYWLLRSAKHGDELAAFYLGHCYNSGRGTTRDTDEAFKWYTRAAEAGVPEAMNNLGLMYERGEGVQRSLETALKWFSRGASKIADAAYNAARLNRDQGDFDKAIAFAQQTKKCLLAKCANLARYDISNKVDELLSSIRGPICNAPKQDASLLGATVRVSGTELGTIVSIHSDARSKWLSVMLMSSGVVLDNVPQSAIKIVESFSNAYNEREFAVEKYVDLLNSRRPIISSADKTIAENGLHAWRVNATIHNDGTAAFNLGIAYGCGWEGIPEGNREDGMVKWCSRAAELGNTQALAQLGHFFAEGTNGLTKNLNKSLEWYSRAADGGSANACFELALIHRNEFCDPDEAVRWLKQATKVGHAKSLMMLGDMYQAGEVQGARDLAKAAVYFRVAEQKAGDDDVLRAVAAAKLHAAEHAKAKQKNRDALVVAGASNDLADEDHEAIDGWIFDKNKASNNAKKKHKSKKKLTAESDIGAKPRLARTEPEPAGGLLNAASSNSPEGSSTSAATTAAPNYADSNDDGRDSESSDDGNSDWVPAWRLGGEKSRPYDVSKPVSSNKPESKPFDALSPVVSARDLESAPPAAKKDATVATSAEKGERDVWTTNAATRVEPTVTPTPATGKCERRLQSEPTVQGPGVASLEDHCRGLAAITAAAPTGKGERRQIAALIHGPRVASLDRGQGVFATPAPAPATRKDERRQLAAPIAQGSVVAPLDSGQGVASTDAWMTVKEAPPRPPSSGSARMVASLATPKTCGGIGAVDVVGVVVVGSGGDDDDAEFRAILEESERAERDREDEDEGAAVVVAKYCASLWDTHGEGFSGAFNPARDGDCLMRCAVEHDFGDRVAGVGAETASTTCCKECANCFALGGSHGVSLRACTGCSIARYCGRACQTAHWKAGHKQLCARPGALNADELRLAVVDRAKASALAALTAKATEAEDEAELSCFDALADGDADSTKTLGGATHGAPRGTVQPAEAASGVATNAAKLTVKRAALRRGEAVAAVEARFAAMSRPGVVMGEDELQGLADVRGAPVCVRSVICVRKSTDFGAALPTKWYHPRALLVESTAAAAPSAPAIHVGKGDALVLLQEVRAHRMSHFQLLRLPGQFDDAKVAKVGGGEEGEDGEDLPA